MIQFSAASLAYARLPGFSALLFSDVKPPTGLLAAYKQPAADDLQQMGLAVLTAIRQLNRGLLQKTQTRKLPNLTTCARTPFWSFCAGQRRIGPGQITDEA